MKLSLTIAAASVVMLTTAASAQMVERRDFIDPLGVWTAPGYASQQQIFSAGPPSKTGSARSSDYASPQMNWESGWDDRRWR